MSPERQGGPRVNLTVHRQMALRSVIGEEPDESCPHESKWEMFENHPEYHVRASPSSRARAKGLFAYAGMPGVRELACLVPLRYRNVLRTADRLRSQLRAHQVPWHSTECTEDYRLVFLHYATCLFMLLVALTSRDDRLALQMESRTLQIRPGNCSSRTTACSQVRRGRSLPRPAFLCTLLSVN
jgi:hypothetical protein